MVKSTAFVLRFHAWFFVGITLLGLSFVYAEIASASNSSAPSPNPSITNISSSTPSNVSSTPNTTEAPLVTPTPGTGYGHFNVSDKGKTCLLLDLSCTVSVDLKNISGVHTLVFALPTNAVSSGTCSGDTSSVSLAWNQGPLSLSLSFSFVQSSDKWESSSISFIVTTGNETLPIISNGTESTIKGTRNDSALMTASSGKSYKCDNPKVITLMENVNVSLNQIQVQPFGGEFGEADVCTAKSGSNPAEPIDTVVPLAVGCVLLGLVAILIITYFVGRCKRTGYEKM